MNAGPFLVFRKVDRHRKVASVLASRISTSTQPPPTPSHLYFLAFPGRFLYGDPMLRFPTKWGLLGVLAAITACADSPKNALTELSPITPDTGFVLTTSLFFTTSSLATFNQDPNALKDSLLVESGDAVLARLGSRLGVLNRGIESNLHLIGDLCIIL